MVCTTPPSNETFYLVRFISHIIDFHTSDEAKPRCYRCLKAGFECLGYERVTQWRHTSIAPLKQNCWKSEPVKFIPFRHIPAPELSLVAFKADICTAHMFNNFVWRAYGSLWLDQAAEGKLGSLSSDAVKALSQLCFGLNHRVQDLQIKGAAQYGKCLRVLAGDLGKDGALARDNQTLIVPILLLLMVSVSLIVRLHYFTPT